MTTGHSGSSYTSSQSNIWMCWCKGCLPMRSPRRRVSPQSLTVCLCLHDLDHVLSSAHISGFVLCCLSLIWSTSCPLLVFLGLSCFVIFYSLIWKHYESLSAVPNEIILHIFGWYKQLCMLFQMLSLQGMLLLQGKKYAPCCM